MFQYHKQNLGRTSLDSLLKDFPIWVIKRLVSLALLGYKPEQFITAATQAPNPTQASRLCQNKPELFFGDKPPKPEKITGPTGWNRIAQEICKGFQKGEEPFRLALIAEVSSRIESRRKK